MLDDLFALIFRLTAGIEPEARRRDIRAGIIIFLIYFLALFFIAAILGERLWMPPTF